MLDVQTVGTTRDRLSEGYEPRWDIDAAVGARGERQTLTLMEAFAAGRVEVKTDERARTTGNVFVEYRCERIDGWHPSGIATTRAEYWAFVVGPDALIAVTTDRLRELARAAFRAGRKRECSRGSHPTRGVVVSLTDLIAKSVGDDVPT